MFGDSRSASAGAEARAWLDVTYADKDAAKALGAPVGRGGPAGSRRPVEWNS